MLSSPIPSGSSGAHRAGTNVAVGGARRQGATSSPFSRVQRTSGVWKTRPAEAERLLCFDGGSRRTRKCPYHPVACAPSMYANAPPPSKDAGSSDSQTLIGPVGLCRRVSSGLFEPKNDLLNREQVCISGILTHPPGENERAVRAQPLLTGLGSPP